ncbi:MAG: hypothetical protein ACRCYR_09990 [Phycicoccus sp.]
MRRAGSPASRLSSRALAWRLGVFVVGVLALVNGTVQGRDEHWPLAPMGQYAFSVPDDGEVRSPGVVADTADGRRDVVVPLTSDGVGVRRAEIEAQVPQIVADPSRLQGLAVQAAARHPGWSRYLRLRLVDDVTLLRDGRVAGTERRVLASWTVTDPEDPGRASEPPTAMPHPASGATR